MEAALCIHVHVWKLLESLISRDVSSKCDETQWLLLPPLPCSTPAVREADLDAVVLLCRDVPASIPRRASRPIVVHGFEYDSDIIVCVVGCQYHISATGRARAPARQVSTASARILVKVVPPVPCELRAVSRCPDSVRDTKLPRPRLGAPDQALPRASKPVK